MTKRLAIVWIVSLIGMVLLNEPYIAFATVVATIAISVVEVLTNR